jgi:Fusaric acid resistance protein-like
VFMTAQPVKRYSGRHSSVGFRSPVRKRRAAWLDWLAGTDPGLMRLRLATEIVCTIGVVLAAEWGFVRGTGALLLPVPAGASAGLVAELASADHALTVIAMMLGAIVAMISGFAMTTEVGARSQLVTCLFLPVPLLATLAVGLSLHARAASLALMAVLLAAGTYCRRFGPRGSTGGVLAFMGAFLGFFVQDLVTVADMGWVAAEIGLGTGVMIAVHFTLFRPRPAAALRRMQRSYAARAHDLASDVADLFAAVAGSRDSSRHRRAGKKLQRHLLRLNETALLIDAQLDNPAAVPAGWSAATLHQRLFDAEAALGNMARFALAIARRRFQAPVSAQAASVLAAARDADLAGVRDSVAAIRALLEAPDPERSGVAPADRVLLHRFATSATDFAAALDAFRLYPAGQVPDDEADGEFRAQVASPGGWLPGSAFVAGTASRERGGGGVRERVTLAPHARIAIQMGVAVGGAIIAGDALSGRRFYWAVIAAFITFMGANTAGEQLRKSLFRVAGTLVGVVIGSVLAHLVGDRVGVQIVVVLAALFLGLYLMRVNYTFMTIGITVMVAQLYVQLDEFSNSLLLLRLEETALGAGVAMATVLLVLPLHIGRVARVAARQQVEALADLSGRCLDRLADPASDTGSDLQLRSAARRVDMAYQALVATVWPSRTPLFGQVATRVAGFMAAAAAARHYARNLILDSSTRYPVLVPAAAADLDTARRRLAGSVAAITTALHPQGAPDGMDRQYVRSASLFARAADRLHDGGLPSRLQLALHDLQLFDGAMAEAARWADIPVADPGTSPGEVPARLSSPE